MQHTDATQPTGPDLRTRHVLNMVAALQHVHIPVSDRCQAIRTLINSIDSRMPDAHLPKDQRSDMLVPPGQFIEECQALATLCKSLNFSQAWQSQAKQRAFNFAEYLIRTYPGKSLDERWSILSIDDRLTLLREAATNQCKSFNTKDIVFTPASLNADDLPFGTYARCTYSHQTPLTLDSSELIVDKQFLEGGAPVKIFSALWHEQLHQIHFQLAHKFQNGEISRDHPFHADAAMLHYKITLQAHGSPRYGIPVYRNDVDERLCFETQDLFTDHHANLSRNFRDIFAPRRNTGPGFHL